MRQRSPQPCVLPPETEMLKEMSGIDNSANHASGWRRLLQNPDGGERRFVLPVYFCQARIITARRGLSLSWEGIVISVLVLYVFLAIRLCWTFIRP